jgi:hypothetical protein
MFIIKTREWCKPNFMTCLFIENAWVWLSHTQGAGNQNAIALAAQGSDQV